MRTIAWIVFFIIAFTGLMVFIQNHTEEYLVKTVCKKTFVTYDHKSRTTIYTVIVQYEDGKVEDLKYSDGRKFFDYKEGDIYYFKRTRWNWNKK